MITIEREITEEQYARAVERGGRIAKGDEEDVFTASERFGFGVYNSSVHRRNGRPYVMFLRGDSCD